MTLAYTPQQSWHRPITTSKTSWLPSTLILAIVFISFRPFVSEVTTTTGTSGGGDIVNQLGFGLMGIYCGYLLLKHASSNILGAFANPVWGLALTFLVLAVFTADSPSSSMRAMIFSLIVVVAAATALALPRNMSEMVSSLTIASLLAVIFCYVAVFFVPEQGVHSGAGAESQHGGLWRGVYDHKNVASYVMGAFVMIGLFAMRNGRPLLGFILAILSFIFVIQAGSKTVLGILPIAIICAATARWIHWKLLRVFIILLPVLGLIAATLGAVIYPPILETLQSFIPGLTYTGRVDLWEFGLQFIQKEPWFGYGFESFWATPRVENMEQPIELSWDIRGIVHGHNSWMDGAIAFGLPAMVPIVLALAIMPIRDFLRIPETGNAARLGTLFLSIWIFTALGASLESFFFRRSDPVWFCMLLAIIGLRITAHMSWQPIPKPTIRATR